MTQADPTQQPSATDTTGKSGDELEAMLNRIGGMLSGEIPPEAPSSAGATAAPAPRQLPPSQPPAPAQAQMPPAQAPARPAPSKPAANPAQPAKPSRAPDRAASKMQLSFGELTGNREEPFIPTTPEGLGEVGLTESMVEQLIAKYLLSAGEATGRAIAEQVKLPFLLIEPILNRLKYEQQTTYRGSNSVNDYIHALTDLGRSRAKQYNLQSTYFGAAPVILDHYVESVKAQSVETQNPRREQLLHAFRDLLIDRRMLGKLGPAVNSGRGMFLYGYPGNGKTSIAERITAAFGTHIWIPRALVIDGEIMRVYDPLMHESASDAGGEGLLNQANVDNRWIRIKRPTIIAGGELSMEMLEVQQDPVSKVSESPLQLKSNCGVLVIDDFGRQKMRVDELLNRWIVPLEKRYDFLNMSSGKKTQVPFDQLVIFSTNLQPKDLVDDAFLRRIPYKIEVENPSEKAFRKLFEIMCPRVGLPYKEDVIDYLIEKHYKPNDRPFRNCHPRDLLLQVRNYCLYNDTPMELKHEYVDFACENYFSIM